MNADSAPLDATHEPSDRSWVASANDPGAAFPLQSLPYGVFSPVGEPPDPRLGVAIGDAVLDLRDAVACGALTGLDRPLERACAAPSLNALLALDRTAWRVLRARLHGLLRDRGDGRPVGAQRDVEPCLVPMASAAMHLPADVGDYTDFYASIHHATNVGRMMRPDAPLLPNYKWVPIAYHGRSSTLVVSGTPVRRPAGQARRDADAAPRFGPSQRLDYELEVAALIGHGNEMGTPIGIDEADEHLFGVCLLNDWSARDLQAWEYQPLGPFLAKNFATSLSAWVVTMEALRPYRLPRPARPEGDPEPLPYLDGVRDRAGGALAITVEAWLSTARMSEAGLGPVRLSRSRFADMYWTLGQMVAHHTSGGCRLRPGDLMASGTVSGPDKEARGCLLELTWRGTEPLALPSGELRRFLEDGDQVILRGRADAAGHPGLALGECRGVVIGREPE